jgi:ATP sulfurylase
MIINKAKVKYAAGQPREGQYGPSINILVVFSDGKEARIYGKPGDAIQSLKQGDVIDVLEDKGKLKYVQSEPTTQQAVESMQSVDKEQPDLAKMVFDLSTVYTQTYIDIYNKLIDAKLPHENATAATSTIFIQIFNKLR